MSKNERGSKLRIVAWIVLIAGLLIPNIAGGYICMWAAGLYAGVTFMDLPKND